jgi:hypothetical protein
LSAVWEVVAQAGAASPCPAGDAGLVAGGEGAPGADLADVGGGQQQLAGAYPLLREVAERAEPGSDGWCTAQFWLGWTAVFSTDLAGAVGHFTVLRDAVADRPPSRALADALAGRAITLHNMGRIPEAVGDARRALAMAREIKYPVGELLALGGLTFAASFAGDHDDAVRLARENHRQMLAQASQRQLRRQHGQQATRTAAGTIIRRLATLIAKPDNTRPAQPGHSN